MHKICKERQLVLKPVIYKSFWSVAERLIFIHLSVQLKFHISKSKWVITSLCVQGIFFFWVYWLKEKPFPSHIILLLKRLMLSTAFQNNHLLPFFILPVHSKEFTGFAKWLGHFLTAKSFAVINYNKFVYFSPNSIW